MYRMENMISEKKSSFFLFNLCACFVQLPSGCWGHSNKEQRQADLCPPGASPPERINPEIHPGPQVWSCSERKQGVGDGAGCWSQGPEGVSGGDSQGWSESWVKPWISSGQEKSLWYFFHFFFFNVPSHIKDCLLGEDLLKIFMYLHRVLIAACQIFCPPCGLLSSCGSWA